MSGIDRIAAERQRQLDVEGWSIDHDLQHDDGFALVDAAVCYAMPPERRNVRMPSGSSLQECLWPFESKWWKPTPDDRIRELEKAGALIAAEIDRLLLLAKMRRER